MDTSMSSQQTMEEPYVSCILIDGHPILPPIMNEAKRAEMRRYRELAVEREQQRQHFNRMSSKVKPLSLTNRDLRPSTASTGSSSNFSPPSNPQLHLTSTPRRTELTEAENNGLSHPDKENMITNKSDRTVLKNKEEDEALEIKSMSTSTSSSCNEAFEEEVSSLDELPNSNNNSEVDEDDNDGGGGGGNFASTDSSTGTFIIRTSLSRNKGPRSEGEVEEIEEDDDEQEEAKVTKSNSVSKEEPTLRDFRRKRPLRYFDTDDEESEEQSTFPTRTNSTTLSKYFTMTQTPSEEERTVTSTPSLPNFVPNEDEAPLVQQQQQQQSPSFTINTEFAATALALSRESSKEKSKPKKVSGSRGSRTRKYFSSPGSPSSKSATESPPKSNSRTSAVDPNFDFILTSEVPHSAEKLQARNPEESDSSDKENCLQAKKKHVRKLSYTVETPSAALLAATTSSTMDGNMFTQTLAPIESVAGSTGVPSTLNTPDKNENKRSANNNFAIPATPTCGDLDTQIDKVQVTLAKFQQLSLGKGKKAHLERYLDELQASESKQNESGSKVKAAEILLTERQLQRQKQLELLKEQFDLQVQKIQAEFEQEQVQIMADIALEEQQKQRESSSQCSSVLADSSNLRSYYISNETPTKDEQILSQLRSGSSSAFAHVIPGTPTSQSQQSDLGTVGLSKLQKQMQKMNPALFKNPSDARSPLLKGLVFPDPLERPKAPLKIPAEANNPEMKPKYDRITALIKGYLTRRLLHSEKLQIIIQTIKDTVELLLKLYDESSVTENGREVKSQDEELHRRLIQQLAGACASFHDVFFKLSVKERMAIIANDREKMKAKALRNVLNRQNNPLGSPSKKIISTATLKSIERRLTHERSPKKKDNHLTRKSVKSSSYGFPMGSRSVKPKPVISHNISPKRRRLSYWEDKPRNNKTITRTTGGINVDKNGNKWAIPESGRSTNSASTNSARHETSQSSGWSSDTFLVPSTNNSSRQTQNSSKSSRPSTGGGNSRFSVGVGGGNRSGRNSNAAKVPWK